MNDMCEAWKRFIIHGLGKNNVEIKEVQNPNIFRYGHRITTFKYTGSYDLHSFESFPDSIVDSMTWAAGHTTPPTICNLKFDCPPDGFVVEHDVKYDHDSKL